MKFKKYIAALLALVTILFSGCEQFINDLIEENFPSNFDDGFFEDEEDQTDETSEFEYEAKGRISSLELRRDSGI